MGSLLSQCGAVTMLNLKSLSQRVAMSISSVVAVAMAVGVLLGLFAMLSGFRATMDGSGSDDVAVVTRVNTTSEISSVITADQVRIISAAPGIQMRGDDPMISAELMLIVDAVKRSTGTAANMPFRGIDPNGLAIRSNARVVEGRMFTPGTAEIVVGRSLLREFSGFELGRTVRLGNNNWEVVGVFEAPGTVFESELWADARVVQSIFQRGSTFQVLRAKLASPQSFEAFKTFVEGDARLQLEARTEREYMASQASGTIGLINFIGIPLSVIMGIGALAAALNTMFASVAARSAEIATLRIIGFSGFAAFFGTLIEALALSVIGALVALVVCYLLFNGMTASTLGSSFTQVVFQLKITPELVVAAIVMALVIGLVGGIFPGIRAARQSPQLELASQ